MKTMKTLLVTGIVLLISSMVAYVQQTTQMVADVNVSSKVIIFTLSGAVATLAGYIAFLHRITIKEAHKKSDEIKNLTDNHSENMIKIIKETHKVMIDHREAVNNNTAAQDRTFQLFEKILMRE